MIENEFDLNIRQNFLFIFQKAKENYKLKNRNAELSGEEGNRRKPQHKEMDGGMNAFTFKPTKVSCN